MPTHPRRYAAILVATGVMAAGITVILTAGRSAVAEPAGSSAFGVSATGASPLSPQPSVSSPDGEPVSDSAPIASADGSITATATVRASTGQAEATVQGLSLLFGQVAAGQVTATCRDGAGTVTIAGGQAAGTPLPAAPAVRQTIPVGGAGSVVLNTQTTNSDGSTTIVGLRATIATPGGAAETITVASATCVPTISSPPTSPSPTTTSAPSSSPTHPSPTHPGPSRTASGPGQLPVSTAPSASTPVPDRPSRPAPAPTPVATHVAVTG